VHYFLSYFLDEIVFSISVVQIKVHSYFVMTPTYYRLGSWTELSSPIR